MRRSHEGFFFFFRRHIPTKQQVSRSFPLHHPSQTHSQEMKARDQSINQSNPQIPNTFCAKAFHIETVTSAFLNILRHFLILAFSTLESPPNFPFAVNITSKYPPDLPSLSCVPSAKVEKSCRCFSMICLRCGD